MSSIQPTSSNPPSSPPPKTFDQVMEDKIRQIANQVMKEHISPAAKHREIANRSLEAFGLSIHLFSPLSWMNLISPFRKKLMDLVNYCISAEEAAKQIARKKEAIKNVAETLFPAEGTQVTTFQDGLNRHNQSIKESQAAVPAKATRPELDQALEAMDVTPTKQLVGDLARSREYAISIITPQGRELSILTPTPQPEEETSKKNEQIMLEKTREFSRIFQELEVSDNPSLKNGIFFFMRQLPIRTAFNPFFPQYPPGTFEGTYNKLKLLFKKLPDGTIQATLIESFRFKNSDPPKELILESSYILTSAPDGTVSFSSARLDKATVSVGGIPSSDVSINADLLKRPTS